MSDIVVTPLRSSRFGPRHLFAILGAVLLIVVSVFVAGVRPAQAAASDCPSGSACVWRDLNCVTASSGANYRDFVQYITDYRQYNYRNTTSNVNDTETGVKNAGNFESVRWYTDWFKGGTYFTFSTGSSDCDLGDGVGLPSSWNNTISSGYFSSFW